MWTNTNLKMANQIDAEQFLQVARPALASGDAAKLARVTRVRWRPNQLCQLTRHPQVDVRRVAALTVGLIGDMRCTPCLTRALRDEDEQVNQMAEHGLWSIWFRAGRTDAVGPFREGVALLSIEAHQEAVERFHEANRIDPDFAEAYNQSAIAHCFLSEWEESLANSHKTIRLLPTHFGAIAGMGHCFAQLGDLDRALQCYRSALRINPRLKAIARAIRGLEIKIPDFGAAPDPLVDRNPN